MRGHVRKWAVATGAVCAAFLAGCHSRVPRPPITLASTVDISRFMGDWYVIANIPTFIEKGAHNAVESYRLDTDGTIATTFTFRAGSFEGKKKRYQPRGFIRDASGAIWGMRFLWHSRVIFASCMSPKTTARRSLVVRHGIMSGSWRALRPSPRLTSSV